MKRSIYHVVFFAGLIGALAGALTFAKSAARPPEPPSQVETAVRNLLRGSGYERVADDPDFQKDLHDRLAKEYAGQERVAPQEEPRPTSSTNTAAAGKLAGLNSAVVMAEAIFPSFIVIAAVIQVHLLVPALRVDHKEAMAGLL